MRPRKTAWHKSLKYIRSTHKIKWDLFLKPQTNPLFAQASAYPVDPTLFAHHERQTQRPAASSLKRDIFTGEIRLHAHVGL